MSKSQIILKLPAVESCAYLSELPGTEFECSIILINGPTWSAMCEERITKTNIWSHVVFSGWVGSFSQKHHFDVLCDKLDIYGIAPKIKQQSEYIWIFFWDIFSFFLSNVFSIKA